MIKRGKLSKQHKIILSLLGIAIILSFTMILKATITGYVVMHNYNEVQLPAVGTTPSGAATGIWPSLNSEFLQSKSLADITGMVAGGGGGSLKVYKSDGTTLLGTFGGFFGGLTSPPTSTSGWGWWTSTGELHIATSADLGVEPIHTTLYYTTADCTIPSYVYSLDSVNGFYTDGVVCAQLQTTFACPAIYSKRIWGGACVYEYHAPNCGWVAAMTTSSATVAYTCASRINCLNNLPCIVK